MSELHAGGYLAQLLQRGRRALPGTVAPRGRSMFEDNPAAAPPGLTEPENASLGQAPDVTVIPEGRREESTAFETPDSTDTSAIASEDWPRRQSLEAAPREPQRNATVKSEPRRAPHIDAKPTSTRQSAERSFHADLPAHKTAEPAQPDPATDRNAIKPRAAAPQALRSDGAESEKIPAQGQAATNDDSRTAKPNDTVIEPARPARPDAMGNVRPAKTGGEETSTRQAAPKPQRDSTSATPSPAPAASPQRGQLEPPSPLPAAPAPSRDPETAQTVQISIGRIEVQAETAPPRQPVRHERPAARPRQPAMSLAAYLEKRGTQTRKGRGK